MISEKQKNLIISTLQPFKPKMIGIFGSYARDENQASSDLDILIEFEETVNLLDIIGLEIELTEKLGVKVDLVTDKAVPAKLESRIATDLQRIY